MLDIVVSLTMIILLAPVFLAISIGILASDGWPILFCQKRVGLNGRNFLLLKFRTMVPGSDLFASKDTYERAVADGVRIKPDCDPRVTRLGRILRKASLDELPQFFNVFAGDMSLVGPRPLPSLYLRGHERFAELRCTMRPGITGLWQIRDRAHSTVDSMKPHDLEYIASFSLSLDLRIIATTAMRVIQCRGAC